MANLRVTGVEGLKGKSVRFVIVVLSSVLTFGLLYFGNWWLTSRMVTRPMRNALLQTAGVTSVTVLEDSGRLLVTVRLSSVPDLRATYSELEKRAHEIAGRRRFEIVIEDRRNPKLEEAYYNIHFDLQQAIATGGFSQMATSVNQKSASLGLDRYRIFVDTDKIYVQLHLGTDYLYEIVPRPEAVNRPTAAMSLQSLGF